MYLQITSGYNALHYDEGGVAESAARLMTGEKSLSFLSQATAHKTS
jgi:hypothetical protein